jgi:cytochrome b561
MTRNSEIAWGWPSKLLHWVGAIIVLLLLGHGWWMTHLAPRPDRLAHYAGHAALGYDLLVLIVLRLLWRWLNPVPTLPAELKTWEVIAARSGHVALYVLLFATSLTGWALAGTLRTPLTRDIFNIPWPQLAGNQNRALHNLLEESHMILAYLLAALVVIHVCGALRHHFAKRNNVLRRMWFGAKA